MPAHHTAVAANIGPTVLDFALLVLGFLALVVFIVRYARRRRVLPAVADRLGLALDDPARRSEYVTGTIDGVAIEVGAHLHHPAVGSHDYTGLAAVGVVPFGVTMIPRDPGAATSVPTGDAAFDALVDLGGPAPAALACLDAPARAAVASFLTRRAGREVVGGQLLAREHLSRAADVLATLDDLVAAGAALQRARGPVPAGLARLVAADPLPGVRRRAMEVLATFPDAPERAAAATLALCDPDPAVRLVAAETADDPAALSVLGALVGDSAVPAAVRLGAALDLGRRAPAHAALTAATPWLLACLDDPAASGAERAHAAEALGAFGDLDLVERLQTAAVGPVPRATVDAIRAAIARIQARVGGAAGALSLTAPDGGALSLTGADAGGLSVVAPSSAPDPPLTEPTVDPAPAPATEAAPWS